MFFSRTEVESARSNQDTDHLFYGGALLLLGAVAFLTFMPVIRDGGFMADDWSAASLHHFNHAFAGFAPGRPLGGPYFSLVYTLGGSDPHAQIAIGLGMGVAMCVALAYALRTAGLSRVDVVGVAILLLVFEPSDAPRMWPVSSYAQLAVAFYLVGLATAWKAFARRDRGALPLHAISLAFYVGSLLLYQTAATVMLMSFALYAVKTAPSRALKRWAADLMVVLVAIVGQASTPGYAHAQGFELVVHAAKMVAGTVLLATWAIFPVGSYQTPTLTRVIGALLILALVVATVRAIRERQVTGLASLSALAASGLVFALISYANYIPAAGYTPVAQGIGNRTNVLAAAGLAVFAWACCRLAGKIALRDLHQWGTVSLAILLVGAYIHADRNDQRQWIAASREQHAVLNDLRGLGKPSTNTHLFVWGGRAFAFTGVPVFFAPYDLEPALQILWNDESLRAVPITRYTTIRCGANHVTPQGLDPYRPANTKYGPHTLFVDVRTRATRTVTTQRRCRRWTSRVEPADSPGL